jgi:hypothetical protein
VVLNEQDDVPRMWDSFDAWGNRADQVVPMSALQAGNFGVTRLHLAVSSRELCSGFSHSILFRDSGDRIIDCLPCVYFLFYKRYRSIGEVRNPSETGISGRPPTIGTRAPIPRRSWAEVNGNANYVEFCDYEMPWLPIGS